MKKTTQFLLSILTGAMLWMSWPPHGFAFLSFFAFIPLLMVSQDLVEKKVRSPFWNGVLFSYLSFFIWNASTTWWVWNSTPEGAIAMVVLNSLFMSLVFGCWQRFRSLGLSMMAEAAALVSFWCSWEFLHLHWDLTWPWLNLGNIFSSCTEYVQWYEFTGGFGGTVWILVANLIGAQLLKNLRGNQRKTLRTGSALLLWIILPAVGSLVHYHTYPHFNQDPKKDLEIIIAQPNTDPWEEEYFLSNRELAQRILSVSDSLLTPKTSIIVCPESAIPHSISYDGLYDHGNSLNENYNFFDLFDSTLATYPQLNIITGMSTVKFYDHKATETARETGNGHYMDFYNTSICYNRKGVVGTYFKSKLVPGVEKMPYPQIFGFLEKAAIDLGGTSGSLGRDSVQRVFEMEGSRVKVGVPICYESAYGEHFGEFVRNGAQLMAVITNDACGAILPGTNNTSCFPNCVPWRLAEASCAPPTPAHPPLLTNEAMFTRVRPMKHAPPSAKP